MTLSPETLLETLDSRVRTRFPHVAVVKTVESTNNVLWDMHGGGYGDGTVVLAESQSGGRGRLGRTWESPPGNLYMSILRKMKELPEKAGIISLLTGIAVAQTVADLSGVKPSLKWPNDVLVGSGKLAGILLEARDDWQVVGIGLNVNCPADSLSIELTGVATSLLDETGRWHSVEALAGGILTAFCDLEKDFEQEACLPVERYKAFFPFMGNRVHVYLHHRVADGVIVAIDPDGSLVLQDEGGQLHRINSGEVKHVR